MGAKRPEPVPTPVDYSSDDFHCSKCRISSACLNEESVCCSCERDELRRQLAESRDRERELLAACKSAEWYGCDPISFAKIQAALRDCGEGEGDG